MTKTQKGGLKVKSAYSFIERQVKKELYNKQKSQFILTGTAKQFVNTVTLIVLAVVVNQPILKAQIHLSEKTNLPLVSSINFDRENFQPLAITPVKVEIKPGKSRVQLAYEASLAAKSRTINSSNRSVQSTSLKLTTLMAHQMAQHAASKAGIAEHWKVLAAVWQKETGKSGDSCIVSRADGRATGPMQFMPSTFRAHAPAGADICKVTDALAAAADLLKESGLDQGDTQRALYSYNHSTAYVKSVEQIARSIE